ncbi:helix-turn-helix transcriptional regulator [Pseudomonas sessilinigenes]|uniref:Helix-turn-helix transcriptional regulator n=1 Tax=Pseudomonas sessilinigenes TaxID=658629 RepID=A0ABX8MKX2_9PSED|nr:helix-turn-helix transcriptional regulator [Pseudomonas sessilinigenes]AZC27227.1 Transcriptional regulator, AraC family [Pseudomonas sessilinigenes]QXH38844.1 helix-turn-helix transcriptional regulator [Pseudomonas sessilinigenes]
MHPPSHLDQRYFLRDFRQLGERHAVHYSLPGLSVEHDDICLMQGLITEHRLPGGLVLVNSDVLPFHSYRVDSLRMPCLSLALVLEGRAALSFTREQALLPGHCIATLCADDRPLSALHFAGPRLRGLNLALNSPEDLPDAQLAQRLHDALRRGGSQMTCHSLPLHVRQAIDDLGNGRWHGSLQQLLCQGVALQLLAHTLAGLSAGETQGGALTPRDRQLLERVRERLYQAPGEEHSLTELAQLACMSSSSLRSKFRAAYGQTVFGYLRGRRLDVAYAQLQQGWSVQQAAHFVGYRHASNFTTAFRQRFGIAPGSCG